LLKRDNVFYHVREGDPFGDIFAAEFLAKIWRPVEKPLTGWNSSNRGSVATLQEWSDMLGQCSLGRRLRSRLRPTNNSWRVDETYIRVKGKWVYLYRAVDSSGATIDFLVSAKRDAAAAERFLAKALGGENHPAPRVINTDEHAGYPPAIVRLKAEEALKEALKENCRHRPVQYLNNVLEQDHRAIKGRIRASQHFRSFWGAWRTIAGYEAIHMIRKGQAYGSAAAARGGLLHCFILGLFSAVTV
jgi:IS6 family transposase